MRPLLEAIRMSIGLGRSGRSFHSPWLSRGTLSRNALPAARRSSDVSRLPSKKSRSILSGRGSLIGLLATCVPLASTCSSMVLTVLTPVRYESDSANQSQSPDQELAIMISSLRTVLDRVAHDLHGLLAGATEIFGFKLSRRCRR